MTKLSFQTWYIHTLSVVDWLAFIEICWQYAYQSKSKKLVHLTTSLGTFFLSGICILTWHYFFNSTDLIWLIIFQSFLTLIGNISLMYSSRRLYDRI